MDVWKIERYRQPESSGVAPEVDAVRIGDLVTQRTETADPTSPRFRDLPYLGLDAVESGTGEILSTKTAGQQEIRSRSKVFRTGDVLYGRLRAYLNKVTAVDSTIALGTCSGEFYVLAPDTSKILPQFLQWVLSTDDMVGYVKLRLAGATHPRLAFDDLMDYRVELPTLDLQRSAVSIIRESVTRRRSLVAELSELRATTSARVWEAVYGTTVPEYNERSVS